MKEGKTLDFCIVPVTSGFSCSHLLVFPHYSVKSKLSNKFDTFLFELSSVRAWKVKNEGLFVLFQIVALFLRCAISVRSSLVFRLFTNVDCVVSDTFLVHLPDRAVLEAEKNIGPVGARTRTAGNSIEDVEQLKFLSGSMNHDDI